jgi:Dyp-type peroxidase family
VAQSKGVLPRREDREVLYGNARACGYVIGVNLDPGIDRARAEAWLDTTSGLIDALVARLPAPRGAAKGEKVAAVAVGLAPRFFGADGSPRFDPPVEPPAGFALGPPAAAQSPALAGVPSADIDVMFYVASVFEARVNAFVSKLSEMAPDVVGITLDRGYQRLDETEPFGYRDGVRNVRRDERSKFVFVHRDGKEADEPVWADGGTYMAFLRILQRPQTFAQLPDDTVRDAVIGRTKDGTRLDLVGAGVKPHDEPADPTPELPPTSHVLKAGPRGVHDSVQIFRRGLPFVETTTDGQVRVGLNFCSFQATLDQFDVVFLDWMMSRNFPPQPGGGDAGLDALMDPARGFTAIEKAGFFFVPPHHPEGLAAAVFMLPAKKPPKTGQVVVHKRVVDPTDPQRRFERRGFVFQVLDVQNQAVPGAQFETDSTGRGVCPVELEVGQTYTLHESASNVVPDVQLSDTPFVMDKPNKQIQVINQVTRPNAPYAG